MEKHKGNLIPGSSPQSLYSWHLELNEIQVIPMAMVEGREGEKGGERKNKIMTINNLKLQKMLIESIL